MYQMICINAKKAQSEVIDFLSPQLTRWWYQMSQSRVTDCGFSSSQ